MAAELSRMNTYLEALPRGIDSYPDYVQKASVYREFVTQMPSTGLQGLPGPLAQLLERPLPVSAWVPEVHAHALYLAIADVHLPVEADFLARKLAANRRIIQGPLYRLMMMVLSPEILIRGASSRWKRFHRGITLIARQTAPGTVVARMEFPSHLLPDLIARTYAMVFQVTLEAAGGRDARFALRASGPTFADYEGGWE